MKTVHEVSRFTGVSVRTLHHYDAIGLLKPAEVTEAGYRLYDDAALGRLQIILMFRELRFPLKEIKKIMESPDFDRKEALAQQIRLLELQREHIGGLIAFAREIQEKGVEKMNFDAFWNEEVEQYAEEVRERWGTADAYKEFEEKKGKGRRGLPSSKERDADLICRTRHVPRQTALRRGGAGEGKGVAGFYYGEFLSLYR